MILTTFVSAYTIKLEPGWNLKGAVKDLDVAAIFKSPDIDAIWSYEDGKWYAYLPQVQNYPKWLRKLQRIKAGEGY